MSSKIINPNDIKRYVHFDVKASRAVAIKYDSITDEDNIAVEIEAPLADAFMQMEENLFDWTVIKENDEYVFIKKSIGLGTISKLEATCFAELHQTDEVAIVALQLHKNEATLIINITEDDIQAIKKQYDSSKIIFYVTKKNKPEYLIDELVFDIANTDTYKQSTKSDYRDCSIFTNTIFKSYKLEINV